MGKLVDDVTLAQWRALDVLEVLERLGCYAKQDTTFIAITAKSTDRYHVNANHYDWELLITGSRFWDTRARRGGGGAVDLVMHLFDLDFKKAVVLLHKAFPNS